MRQVGVTLVFGEGRSSLFLCYDNTTCCYRILLAPTVRHGGLGFLNIHSYIDSVRGATVYENRTND